MLAISVISLIKAPISIIVFITAVSAIAVNNKYLWGRPLPYFSSNYGLALDNNWGSASKSISLANLMDFYSLTKSCGSSR